MAKYTVLKAERDEARARALEAERLSNREIVRDLEQKLSRAEEERRGLDECLRKFREQRQHIVALLDEAEAKVVKAWLAHGEEDRRALLTEACDLEYEALGNCEAAGGLIEAFGIDSED